jgi:hypothetical protein
MAGSLKLINVNKLVKLKYNVCEANWITNLSKLYLKEKNIEMSVEEDGHTGFTDMYTKVIVSSIISDKEWAKYHVHLNYDYVFNHFYYRGFGVIGNSLLRYSFNKPDEYKLLKEYRNGNVNLVPLVRIANK